MTDHDDSTSTNGEGSATILKPENHEHLLGSFEGCYWLQGWVASRLVRWDDR